MMRLVRLKIPNFPPPLPQQYKHGTTGVRCASEPCPERSGTTGPSATSQATTISFPTFAHHHRLILSSLHRFPHRVPIIVRPLDLQRKTTANESNVGTRVSRNNGSMDPGLRSPNSRSARTVGMQRSECRLDNRKRILTRCQSDHRQFQYTIHSFIRSIIQTDYYCMY
jgi:hypothetical protein